MLEPEEPAGTGPEVLALADWRRRIGTLYAEVRERAVSDPRAAWTRWRDVREAMYREHPQSPVQAARRTSFRALHWPYDPALRFDVAVEPIPADASAAPPPSLPMSAGSAMAFTRLGRVHIPFLEGVRSLDLFWMAGYAGGLFLPFRDATNGQETYGAGRYLLDAAKAADLGANAGGSLILDFNFAFQPSCAFDPRWACPLAPPENRLDIRIEAGERIA
jgi:hypothetical protein